MDLWNLSNIARATEHNDGGAIVNDARGRIVADVYSEASARLIAAAPDLLAALEAAHEALGATKGYYTSGPSGLVTAAIRKAKGE